MKVYVDKNDVDIIEDLFQATNSYECWDCNRDDDLEIVSLADYTKQVRKELIDKLAIFLIATFSKDAEFSVEEILNWLQEVKDQIQGE